MNTEGLTDLFEVTTLDHYSIACMVNHAFGKKYRCQEVNHRDCWCILGEDGDWYTDVAVYHTLRTALSSELAPFLHGHISYLIRHRTHESELIERLQTLEKMLLDAPQKDWIMKECKSVMFWDPPLLPDDADASDDSDDSEPHAPMAQSVKVENQYSPYTFYI